MELGGGFEPPEHTKKDHTKNSQIPPPPPPEILTHIRIKCPTQECWNFY